MRAKDWSERPGAQKGKPHVEHERNWLEAVRDIGVDGIGFSEDIGTQRALFVSPAMFREFILPEYVYCFQDVIAAGKVVHIHSCGCVTEIAADLASIPSSLGGHPGQMILNPIQHNANDLEITGDRSLFAQTRRALEYLRGRRALVISGTNGIAECWHSDQTGSGDLGETCATAYLIRLLSRLLQIEGDGWYGDWMERSIYNALFAAQTPDGRRLNYYVPLEGDRKIFDRDTYCCPGNFRRIIGELPEMVFYRQDDGLTVNLYTQSSVRTTLSDGTTLTLRQHTDYPQSGLVRLEVQVAQPTRFTLGLRRPAWCSGFAVTVNGQSVALSGSDHYPAITRAWKPGDQVSLTMPMPWRLVRGFRTQAGKVAAMRGPQLYSLPAPLAGTATFNPQSAESDMGLKPFPDPAGHAAYFTCADSPLVIDDELFLRSDGGLLLQ